MYNDGFLVVPVNTSRRVHVERGVMFDDGKNIDDRGFVYMHLFLVYLYEDQ